MLHRNKPPNMGLWNGVGGRIEPGEAPTACILREIFEETGLQVNNVRFSGLLTWEEGFEIDRGGLYIYTAQVDNQDEPVECNEGKLAWKPRSWVLSASEVVSNIHHFGPAVFQGLPPEVHHFVYQEGEIIQYLTLPIKYGLNVS